MQIEDNLNAMLDRAAGEQNEQTDGVTLVGMEALIQNVVEKQREFDAANAALKKIRIELEDLERRAATLLATTGFERVRCGGRTWWTAQELHVSVTSENRDKVLAAAKQVDLDAVSVNTSRIKGWLNDEMEKRRDAGDPLPEKAQHGTPFDGLVSEYSEVKLRSRKV